MRNVQEAFSVLSDLLHLPGEVAPIDDCAHSAGLVWDRVEIGMTWRVGGLTTVLYEPPLPCEKGRESWWGLAVYEIEDEAVKHGINLYFAHSQDEFGWIKERTTLACTTPTPSSGVMFALMNITKKSPSSSPGTYIVALATALLRLHAASV